jgi:hypothetical protein
MTSAICKFTRTSKREIGHKEKLGHTDATKDRRSLSTTQLGARGCAHSGGIEQHSDGGDV